jgi:hypothetical protein
MHRGLDLEALIPGVFPVAEGFHVSPDGRSVASVAGKEELSFLRNT